MIARRRLFARSLAALAGLAVAGLPTPALARDFRAADTQPEDYPTVRALNHLGRLVAERSQRRHRIQVFHSRQLGEEKDTIEQTRVGAIDINRSNVAPFASFVPEAGVLAMPFLFRSAEHLHAVLDGPIGEEILARFENYGFVGLAFYDSGARSIYNSVRPVRSLADVRGLRLRVQQSDQMVRMFEAFGAVPVALPYGQVLTGLTTKIIDGAENNWPSYVTTEHYTAARYYTVTEHVMSPEVVVMSRRAWDSLDAADRQLFREAARDSARFMREEWRAFEERSRKTAVENGAVVIEGIDRAPFEAAVKPIYEAALVDPLIRDLVERIREVR